MLFRDRLLCSVSILLYLPQTMLTLVIRPHSSDDLMTFSTQYFTCLQAYTTVSTCQQNQFLLCCHLWSTDLTLACQSFSVDGYGRVMPQNSQKWREMYARDPNSAKSPIKYPWAWKQNRWQWRRRRLLCQSLFLTVINLILSMLSAFRPMNTNCFSRILSTHENAEV